MIPLSPVSLQQARADCGLSGSGGLSGVTEFRDRTLLSNPTLYQTRGTVTCKHSKAATGTYGRPTNPGSGCRKNYAEPNTYSADGNMNVVLGKSGANLTCEAGGWTGYDVLGGYSFVGTIPSSNTPYRLAWQIANTGGSGSAQHVEVIGWTSGYFAGSPTYYLTWNGSSGLNEQFDFALNGSATPYITICLQAFSYGDGSYTSKTEIGKLTLTNVRAL